MTNSNQFSDTGPDQIYQKNLKNNQFELPKCTSCAKFHFFPRVVCPHCGSFELEWQPVSGKGEVYSTTTVRRKPERGGNYNVCLVTLEEGPRMMSRVDGVDSEIVSIGDQVIANIINDDNNSYVVFTPLKGA
ncbi:MAG: OB-fold domain-containing protein [Cycloclasticus sp.]|nr:OB-fold domain-containing protein [Cycloclasticus sp.]